MQANEKFKPTGAVAFFLAMLTFYAALWLLIFKTMVERN